MKLARVVAETGLNTDAPQVELEAATWTITAKLMLGADVTATVGLWANEALSSRGVNLHGAGFIVTPAKAAALGRVPGLEAHVLPFVSRRDLAQRSRRAMLIDFYGLTDREVMERSPEVYAHFAEHVRSEP